MNSGMVNINNMYNNILTIIKISIFYYYSEMYSILLENASLEIV